MDVGISSIQAYKALKQETENYSSNNTGKQGAQTMQGALGTFPSIFLVEYANQFKVTTK